MESNSQTSLIDPTSLNHGKIVVVDGQTLITEGHNLQTGEYLENSAVHDVSVELTGSAARSADRFSG